MAGQGQGRRALTAADAPAARRVIAGRGEAGREASLSRIGAILNELVGATRAVGALGDHRRRGGHNQRGAGARQRHPGFHLDEPAANLDPRARIEFRTLIRELAAMPDHAVLRLVREEGLWRVDSPE